MLENLTKRLMQDELNEWTNDVFIEAVSVPSMAATIDRYSLINDSDKNIDISDFKEKVESVQFQETASLDERKEFIYNAVTE
jgi:hypothetical protein